MDAHLCIANCLTYFVIISRSDMFVQSDIFIPSMNGTSGAFIAARVSKGGCGAGSATGIFYMINVTSSTYKVYTDYGKLILSYKFFFSLSSECYLC